LRAVPQERAHDASGVSVLLAMSWKKAEGQYDRRGTDAAID
jgi:hypothetical protein